MRKIPTLFLCLTIASAAMAFAPPGAREANLRSLVENERGFARAAVERGIRDAFLTFIAEDGVLFRPTAVNGKRWLQERPRRRDF